MKVVLDFDDSADIIDCPSFIVDDIINYQINFIDWLNDESNNHCYWNYTNGRKNGVSFRCEAFVEYLNRYILNRSNDKASIIDLNTNTYDKSLPKIKFHVNW